MMEDLVRISENDPLRIRYELLKEHEPEAAEFYYQHFRDRIGAIVTIFSINEFENKDQFWKDKRVKQLILFGLIEKDKEDDREYPKVLRNPNELRYDLKQGKGGEKMEENKIDANKHPGIKLLAELLRQYSSGAYKTYIEKIYPFVGQDKDICKLTGSQSVKRAWGQEGFTIIPQFGLIERNPQNHSMIKVLEAPNDLDPIIREELIKNDILLENNLFFYPLDHELRIRLNLLKKRHANAYKIYLKYFATSIGQECRIANFFKKAEDAWTDPDIIAILGYGLIEKINVNIRNAKVLKEPNSISDEFANDDSAQPGAAEDESIPSSDQDGKEEGDEDQGSGDDLSKDDEGDLDTFVQNWNAGKISDQEKARIEWVISRMSGNEKELVIFIERMLAHHKNGIPSIIRLFKESENKTLVSKQIWKLVNLLVVKKVKQVNKWDKYTLTQFGHFVAFALIAGADKSIMLEAKPLINIVDFLKRHGLSSNYHRKDTMVADEHGLTPKMHICLLLVYELVQVIGQYALKDLANLLKDIGIPNSNKNLKDLVKAGFLARKNQYNPYEITPKGHDFFKARISPDQPDQIEASEGTPDDDEFVVDTDLDFSDPDSLTEIGSEHDGKLQVGLNGNDLPPRVEALIKEIARTTSKKITIRFIQIEIGE